MKKLRVTVEGKAYEVLVEILDEGASTPIAAPTAPVRSVAAAAPAAAPAPAPTAPAATGGPGEVRSPLSGKLVSIDVKVGDQVNEGAQVATVEAMKMNTYIFAPKAGRVEAVFGNPGDGIEEGHVLMRIV